MKPTKAQKKRRRTSFEFTYRGVKSWFYLCEEDGASFHQPASHGQQNVFGLRISTLINALKKCGYIALFLCLPAVVEAKEVVGGFMIVSAASLEEAIQVARECPGVIMPGSSVEVREIHTP